MERTKIVGLNLNLQDLEKVKKLLDEGNCDNISRWVRTAVKEKLERGQNKK